MRGWIVRRAITALLVAITVSIFAFAMLRLSGDLAASLAGPNAQPEEIEQVRVQYGLHRPLYVQYADWASSALTGDLGRSIFTSEPVHVLIMERVGTTIRLAFSALVLAVSVGIPLGVLAAANPNSWLDRFALSLAVVGQAIPNFWFGLILIIFFGVMLRMLPISGSDNWLNFVLPTVTLAVNVMPALMRITRSGMLDVLQSDYIRTARAKGLSGMQVFFKHGLRNAVLPVVSLAAVTLGQLLGGSVVVETVFGMNGIGSLAYQSILQEDFPVVQAIVMMIAWVYILLTLLADIINGQLDPRLRVG